MEPPNVELLLPEGRRRTLHEPLRAGETLADLLRREGLPLNTRCGQRGACNGCMIELQAGSLRERTTGRVVQMVDSDAGRMLRSCEYEACEGSGARLRIPARSLLRHEPQITTTFRTSVPVGSDPLGSPAPGSLSAAIDLGTTTVVVLLVDPRSGRILATEAAMNAQAALGDDVLTRISLCASDPAMLARLQRAAIDETILPLLRAAARRADVAPAQIGCIAVAGNTTMLHLLAGVDPAPMGVAPFTPVFLDHRVLRLPQFQQAGIDAEVHLLPGCAAYVGADIAAGIFASGMLYEDGPVMLADLGTNGEIVLMHAGRLLGCATAAGPAFEGSGLECGVRAGEGAIAHIDIAQAPRFDLSIEVIGAAPARNVGGICGSGYIDLLARGRESGLLTQTGRFDRGAAHFPRERLVQWQEHGLALRIIEGDESIVVSERDIARLLQAKAAIAAGVLTLLNRAGLKTRDVKTLYVAGGFGMHLDVGSAIRCGLLPGFDPVQVQSIGNSSLAGAYLALLDRAVIDELSELRSTMRIIELNRDAEFESRYIDQLLLP